VRSADRRSITTIEGLGSIENLHPAQKAFIEKNAMQCGYCTSGMIISSVALLQENPKPTREEIVAWMNGNICRCNGYAKILDAVGLAAEEMRGESHG
jgi:carbon-monoxide dehydrogenase small subunit